MAAYLPRERSMSLELEVFAVAQLLGSVLDWTLAGTSVTPRDFAVYSLMQQAGPTTPTELARMAGMAPTTMSDYLRRFMEQGHAHRLPNPRDGRSYRVALTPAGGRLVAELEPRFAQVVRRIEEQLDVPSAEVRIAHCSAGRDVPSRPRGVAAE
ncbi:hypothetical protein BH20CHL6_BH20CHL6_14940 [soil metagenome]